MGDLRSCYVWPQIYIVIFVQSVLQISAFLSVKRKCYKIFKLSFRMVFCDLFVTEEQARHHGSLKMGCVGKEFSLCPD